MWSAFRDINKRKRVIHVRYRTGIAVGLLFAALLSACVGGKSDGGSRTYTVSGKVVYETENGKPAAGVRIQLTGATGE